MKKEIFKDETRLKHLEGLLPGYCLEHASPLGFGY